MTLNLVGNIRNGLPPADYLQFVQGLRHEPNPSAEQPGTRNQRLEALQIYHNDTTRSMDRDRAWQTARYFAGETQALKD